MKIHIKKQALVKGITSKKVFTTAQPPFNLKKSADTVVKEAMKKQNLGRSPS